jgi:hypothetical protein
MAFLAAFSTAFLAAAAGDYFTSWSKPGRGKAANPRDFSRIKNDLLSAIQRFCRSMAVWMRASKRAQKRAQSA